MGRTGSFIKAVIFSRVTTRVAFPVLAAFPTAIFAAAALRNPWPNWFFSAIPAFEQDHPQVRTVVVFFPLIFVPLAFFFERWREKLEKAENLAEEELSLLLRILERPVGRKRLKFGELVRRFKNSAASPDTLEMLTAADPGEQIRCLVEGIYHAFQGGVKRPDELKVTLARMVADRIDEFECFLPQKAGPRTSALELRVPECTFSIAAEQRRLIIIPDIKKELSKPKKKRRFAAGKDGGLNSGSMICYPIFHHELATVPYVIGVKYSEPNHFTSDSERRYEFILSQFAERICLEFSLRKLSQARQNP
jgi:hypothetical protein